MAGSLLSQLLNPPEVTHTGRVVHALPVDEPEVRAKRSKADIARDYRERNREKIQAAQKRCIAKNPEKYRLIKAAYRARQRAAREGAKA